MKLVLNYDYKAYPYTTASYVELAAKQIPGVELFRVPELTDQTPDLVINIMPFDNYFYIPDVPTAYWEIDNHIMKGCNKAYYDLSTIVYVPQEPFISFYPKNKTKILGLGACPERHRMTPDTPIEFDVGFIGNDTYPLRRDLLDRLERNFNVLRTTSEPGIPYSDLLSKCALTFNCAMDKDVNMRFFEAMAVGRMLLTDYLPQQDSFAVAGKHYVAYADWPDLQKKVQYYLQFPQQREEIAQAGVQNILNNNTYKHRLLQILSDFGYHLNPTSNYLEKEK